MQSLSAAWLYGGFPVPATPLPSAQGMDHMPWWAPLGGLLMVGGAALIAWF